MKNLCKFRMEKKRSRSRLKSRFGRILGSIWKGLGSLWAGFWSLLGAFCLPFRRSNRYLFKVLVQNDLQKAFWMDFGLLLAGFGKVLGGFWEGFGRICEDLGPFEQLIRRFWIYLTRFGPAGADSLIGPPRWPAKRHNARGSSTPRVLNGTLENVKSFISSK